jgi:hypothetical protein
VPCLAVHSFLSSPLSQVSETLSEKGRERERERRREREKEGERERERDSLSAVVQ